MLNPYQARVDRRAFLNLPGFYGGAYVVAYVEDTSKRRPDRPRPGARGHTIEPRIILEIADCSERISLEFEIRSALHRMNSFHKLDTLITTLQAFRAGLAEECELYKQREHEQQTSATESRDDERNHHHSWRAIARR